MMDIFLRTTFPEALVGLYDDYRFKGGNIWGRYFEDHESIERMIAKIDKQEQGKTDAWGRERMVFMQKLVHQIITDVVPPELQQEETFQPFAGVVWGEILSNIPDDIFDLEPSQRKAILASSIDRSVKIQYAANQVEKETQSSYIASFQISESGINLTVEDYPAGIEEVVHPDMVEGQAYPYADERYSWTTTRSHLTVVKSKILDPRAMRTAVVARNIDDQKYGDLASIPQPSGWKSLLEEKVISVD